MHSFDRLKRGYTTDQRANKWLVIVNPLSNKGGGKQSVSTIECLLKQKNIPFDLVSTAHARHAWELASEHGDRYKVIVAAGGDGTIHEIINGILDKKQSAGNSAYTAAVGFIPIGSGNDFVKTLNIPGDILQAIEVIETGKKISIDVGEVRINNAERRFFNNNVGVGFDAYVNYETLKIKALRGLAAYLSAVLKTIFTYKHPVVRYDVGGERHEKKILLINIGNGTCSGGGFYLTPAAKPDDGWLDVCIIESMNKMRIFKELPKAMDGSHVRVKGVTMLRSKTVLIESNHPLPVHADGEMLSMDAKTISLTIIPQIIEIIVN